MFYSKLKKKNGKGHPKESSFSGSIIEGEINMREVIKLRGNMGLRGGEGCVRWPWFREVYRVNE